MLDEATTSPCPEPPVDTLPEGIPALEAAASVPYTPGAEILLITGTSGAGKSQAAAVLEDLDWYVVDNLPVDLLEAFVGLMTHSTGGIRKLAAVIDARGREFIASLDRVLDDLRAIGIEYHILFLDASDEVLVRRYESNRRPHPLQADGTLLDGLRRERALLTRVRERADTIIDTSELNIHDLSKRVRESVGGSASAGLRLNVLSFGFKYGLPLDADHVVDVRFLKNPYWVSELRHLTGKDHPVRDFVLDLPGAELFVERYVEALEPVLAGYRVEEKSYATIAVGCTGGKHRSVAMSEAIAAALRARGQSVVVSHRDLGRE
jgi:UPF0042 nucleotide-binding protein